jgi:hypothetical protein
MQINEGVCIDRSTVGTLRSVDCLLKHTFIKNNKYVVDQTLEYFDVSFTSLFARNRVFPCCYTICLSMLVILLYEIKLNRFLNPSFSFENNIEVHCFNAIA